MIATVLRSGGPYRPEHVQRLGAQAQRYAPQEPFVCLSDVHVPDVETVPLRHGWPGWWAKLELFRAGAFPDGVRVFYADLDTTFVGRIDDVLTREEPFLALANFYRRAHRQTVGGELGSGLMQWTAGRLAHLYDGFAANAADIMAKCGDFGDQLFVDEAAGARAYWQDVLPGRVVSYKVHCRAAVPVGASVVCFHGKPKPWQVPELRAA